MATPTQTPPKPRTYRAPPALYREPFRILTPADLKGEQWRYLVGSAPIVRSCIQTLIMQASSIDWHIESDDEDAVEYFTNLIGGADGGAGFEGFVSKMIEDSLVLPFGGASEIGHFSDGVVAWFQHIDAATLVPTYDEKFPYAQIDPWSVGRPPIPFKEEQIGRVKWQPEVRSKSYGWTKTPSADALPAIQALLRADRFWQGFLTDSPPSGILDVMDMTEEEARNWWDSWQQMLAGIDPFKVAMLYGGGSDRAHPAAFIPFAKNPSDLSMMEVLKLYAQEVAACFGMTIGDLGLFDQEMRLAGASKMIELTKRQGLARVMRATKTMFDQDILPDHAEFKWDPIDVEDEVRKASAANQRATSIKALADPAVGIISRSEGRRAAVTYGIIPEDALDPDFDPDGQPVAAPPTEDVNADEEPSGVDDADTMEGRSYVPPRAFPINSPLARQMATVADRLLNPVARAFTKRRASKLIGLGLAAYQEGPLAGDLAQRSRADAEQALMAALDRENWWRSPNLVDDVMDILRSAYEEGLGESAHDIDRERVDLGMEKVDLSRTVFNVTNQDVLNLIENRSGAFIANLDDSNRRFIVDAILRGVQRGISSPTIAREILADEARRDVVERWRHRTISIVNTEINWAESRAALDQQLKLGLTKKRWRSVSGLACNICAANDDDGVVDVDYQFRSVFGPTEAPPGHPGVCHCWITYDKSELKALAADPDYWTGGDAPKAEQRSWFQQERAYTGDGAMIAWYLPEVIGKQIQIKGGEPPEHMHVTLAFITDREAMAVDEVSDCLRAVGDHAPLKGTISGIGRFTGSETSDGKDVIYAAVDIPGLAAFRNQIVDCVGRSADVSQTHDFTAHITLAYIDPSEPNPIERIDAISIVLDHLVLAAQDERIVEVKLEGS